MKFLTALLLGLIFSVSGSPHPDGHGPQRAIRCESPDSCTENEIEKAGQNVLEFYVQSGQLETAWLDAKPTGSARKISIQNQAGFAVSFKNPKEKDEKKQVVHILISPSGHLIGAGFDPSQFQEASDYSKIAGGLLIFLIAFMFYFFFLRQNKSGFQSHPSPSDSTLPS